MDQGAGKGQSVKSRKASRDESVDDQARLILQSLPLALLRERGGTIVFASSAFCQLVEASEVEAVVGQPLDRFLPDLAESESALDAILGEDKSISLKQASGTTLSVRVRAFASRDGRTIVFDTEQELFPSLSQKEDSKLAGLGMLVAGVAHEINNPLTFVIPAINEAVRLVDALGGNVAHRAELRELMDEALHGVQRVAKIASDLREFKRGDDAMAPVDVNEVVVETLRLAEVRLRGKVAIRHVLGAPTNVLGNATRLSQVILNLVLNAAQAMPPDKEDQAVITVRSWHDKTHVHIAVEDNGAGIERGKISKIFDPFFSTKNAGTGLGLSVCAGIVKRLSGWIEVDSEVGRGSIFTVVIPSERDASLPLERQQMPSERPSGTVRVVRPSQPNSPVRALKRMRILVVDDEPLVIRSVQRMMGRYTEVLQATGGWEAIALLRDGLQVECIVSDMVMPEGGGLELWDWVKTHRPELKGRFCFMTGMAPNESSNPDLPPAVHKPFSVEELEQTLSLVVPGTPTRDTVPSPEQKAAKGS